MHPYPPENKLRQDRFNRRKMEAQGRNTKRRHRRRVDKALMWLSSTEQLYNYVTNYKVSGGVDVDICWSLKRSPLGNWTNKLEYDPVFVPIGLSTPEIKALFLVHKKFHT